MNESKLPKQIIVDTKFTYCEGCSFYGALDHGTVDNMPTEWIGCTCPFDDVDDDTLDQLGCKTRN